MRYVRAARLLEQIRAALSASPYAFPGQLPGRSIEELKAFRRRICRPVMLIDFRTRDLLHTYTSILASAGLSLPVTGALLGHTQPNTTAR